MADGNFGGSMTDTPMTKDQSLVSKLKRKDMLVSMENIIVILIEIVDIEVSSIILCLGMHLINQMSESGPFSDGSAYFNDFWSEANHFNSYCFFCFLRKAKLEIQIGLP